jgi:hypothetical protein
VVTGRLAEAGSLGDQQVEGQDPAGGGRGAQGLDAQHGPQRRSGVSVGEVVALGMICCLWRMLSRT